MGTTYRWAQPVVVREQRTLFQPTLDFMIPQDHEVRLLDETLRTLEWSPWEAKYKRGGPGQPPIHPQVLAGIWLYAMMRRIRTSRPLEYACGYNLDFMWLAEGRTPDYSTLATFFSSNKEPLKDLFKQVCRKAMTMGMVRLGEVGFDATRVKAANSRYATLTTPSIEKKLAAIDAQIDAATATAQEDAATTGFGAGTELPEGLKSLDERRKKLAELAEVARTRDEERRQSGTDPKQKPAQVPTTDPQSKVMPNKEGGYAPNYAPTTLTDGEIGIILDTNVLDVVNESVEALPAVDRVSAGGVVSAEAEGRRAGDGRVRNIRRDTHADVRERAATRMATPESKAQYARRSPIAETPFAWLKGVLGLRQFRHVGREKVETEWRWACLTMNLKKILSVLSRRRHQALDALSAAGQQTTEIGLAA